jgi:hypothetical protein
VDFLVPVLRGLNWVMNALFGVLFAPIGWVPGWLSITVVSGVMGVVLLALFKVTSNQQAIGRTRDSVDANLLAIKLFKDNIGVTLKSQATVFASAFKLLYYSIIPMLIMMVPVTLILAQMGLWYQARPFDIGGDKPLVLQIKLNPTLEALPDVSLVPNNAVLALAGPVRVFSKKEVYFKLSPQKEGRHTLVFKVGDELVEKSLTVGTDLMRVNPIRPGRDILDVLLYPLEKPFSKDSLVQSIRIDYPDRDSWVYGTDYWIFYFFVVSMIFAFALKPFLKVRI